MAESGANALLTQGVNDILPAVVSATPAQAAAKLVAYDRKGSLVHHVDRRSPAWTLCNWPHAASGKVFFGDSPSDFGNRRECPRCLKLLADAVDGASSESSDYQSD